MTYQMVIVIAMSELMFLWLDLKYSLGIPHFCQIPAGLVKDYFMMIDLFRCSLY